jgi:hypothetical protein
MVDPGKPNVEARRLKISFASLQSFKHSIEELLAVHLRLANKICH